MGGGGGWKLYTKLPLSLHGVNGGDMDINQLVQILFVYGFTESRNVHRPPYGLVCPLELSHHERTEGSKE